MPNFDIYEFFTFQMVEILILDEFCSVKILFLTYFDRLKRSKFDFWPILIGQKGQILIFDQFW